MKKIKKLCLLLCLIGAIAYGASLIYFEVTGGFRLVHISSDFAPDPRWEMRPLTEEEQECVTAIVSQPFSYLGKGCQSYVFLSEDEEYVIKFFKYQRFRPHPISARFSFLPSVEKLLKKKQEKKNKKLEALYASWKLAFDYFQLPTGLVYVHLNKTENLFLQPMMIYDKMGTLHTLDLDQMEFLIQKRATMLCDRLDQMMEGGEEEAAKTLLTNLFNQVISEYQQGFADNDNALMQNTGVIGYCPVHIDVGQFVRNKAMQEPSLYRQELYNKFYKFRMWLQEKHPTLLAHVDNLFYIEMGEAFFTTQHIPRR